MLGGLEGGWWLVRWESMRGSGGGKWLRDGGGYSSMGWWGISLCCQESREMED